MIWYVWLTNEQDVSVHVYALGIYSIAMSIGFLALYLRRNK